MEEPAEGAAEVVLSCQDFGAALAFFTERLGFRLNQIAPADRPTRARLSAYGLHLALETGPDSGGRLRLRGEGLLVETLRAPNGAEIECGPLHPPRAPVPFAPAFVLQKESAAGAAEMGRAGMLYRDLVPCRLGGALIASHITLPEDGPVEDWVHFHDVGFQLIVCRRGRVKVVYEDQGQPFWLEPFDLVLQPPKIRHRVLESQGRLEVVELGAPAVHDTYADHELELPTGEGDRSRRWSGQGFLRHRAALAPWTRTSSGFERQETGLWASSGTADAVYLRGEGSGVIAAEPGEVMFCAVFGGEAAVEGPAGGFTAEGRDVFTAPPATTLQLTSSDPSFALLQVTVRVP
jgi:hypothetical protein